MTLNSIPYHIPIGKYRCNIICLLDNNTREDWHAFSVIEKLEPDMQDYGEQTIYERANGNGKKAYKLYYTSQDFVVASGFIDNPATNLCLSLNGQACKINTFNQSFTKEPEGESYFTLAKNTSKGVGRILSVREGPVFVKSYIDKDRKVVEKFESEPYLYKQLTQLSEKHFGLDLSEYKEHVGNCYLVWHNEIFKDFHIKSSRYPNGVLIDVIYRSRNFAPFKLRISDKHQQENTVVDNIWDVPSGARSILVPLESFPSLNSISIYSENGMLLFATEPNYFCTNVISNIGICEKAVQVAIKSENGEEKNLTPVNKFSFIESSIGSRIENMSQYFAKNEVFHKIKELADKREFLFFDGSKDEMEKHENKEKAKQAVLDIIKRANEVCYICDPYFNESDFLNYVYPIESLNVKVRIINSKANVNNARLKNLCGIIQKYNDSIKIDDYIQCRVLKGNDSRLHDRFIVADKQVWYLGSSLSELGSRACSLGKFSESAALAVRTYIKEWWASDEITMPIESISFTDREISLKIRIRKRLSKALRCITKKLEN